MDMAGAIDVHVHTAPDVVPRVMDDNELVRAATAAGYAGIVLKSHVESTVGRARLASTARLRVHGGICLNQHCTGGINPDAVDAALRAGGRFVWLPTFTAAGARVRHQASAGLGTVRGGGVQVAVKGAPVEALHEVLTLISEHDAVLVSGHVGGPELLTVVRAAAAHNVRRVLIQHPESASTALPLRAQRELLAEHSGVVFERCLRSVAPDVTAGRPLDPRRLAPIVAHIKALGAERTVLATDYGAAGHCDPITAMDCYARGLIAAGVTVAEIRRMLCDGPARLIGEY